MSRAHCTEVVYVAQPDVVVVHVDQPTVQHVIVEQCERGPRGLKGETGIPEIEMVYAKRVDEVEDAATGREFIYRGDAEPGTAEDAPRWRIRRLEILGDQCDTATLWADGSAAFDKAWSDRLIYDYT